MISTTQQRKKPFSSFNYKDAFKHLGITELKRWTLPAPPATISPFFQQRLERLQRFDLESLDVSKTLLSKTLLSKTLLIDAICDRRLGGH